MTYQLKKDVSDDFEFEIGEDKYKMRYLNGPDRKKLGELTIAIQKLERRAEKATEAELEEIQKEGEKLATETSDLLNSLITPQGETKDIKDVLDNETVPVIRNFQEMIKIEQSLEAQPKVRPSFAS